MSEEYICTHLVIGSGIAGLMLALRLAKRDDVFLVCKGALSESNTRYAQGGIAAAFPNEESVLSHKRDTIVAGAGLCHEDVVDIVAKAGSDAIKSLARLGVAFTGAGPHDQGNVEGLMGFHCTQEGGHSQRRVYHAKDETGLAIMQALECAVREHPRIRILEHHMAIDLLTTDKYAPDFSANRCLGVYVLDKTQERVIVVRSANTYLCTGGHGKIYLYTSNPDSATGDGLAMAWRAGARVANLEFMQFHPTCLFLPQAKNFLISEALRGEGGIIRNKEGIAFIEKEHVMGNLAPRDIVARAIDLELKKSGEPHAFLDMRALGRANIERLFPNIDRTCLQFGIDMATNLIPIVPAAHYSCGGVVTDTFGRTNIASLYALGEVACTGLHGANRLASNSLLEAIVFADRVSSNVMKESNVRTFAENLPPWNHGTRVGSDELVVLSHAWDEIRRIMWHYVGIVRSNNRLQRALSRLGALRDELDRYYWEYQICPEILEVRNLAQVALLTVRCALARQESRGIHYNIDYPHQDDAHFKKDTVLTSL